jgi:hypothetical protein
MIDLLMSLEPRREDPHTVLLEELDEVNEIIFFETGSFGIGYEINHKQRLVIRMNYSSHIGAYGVTFNLRSDFIYKTFLEC